ncbi:putative N-acetyltransferase p20-like protein 2 [Colletotrichum chlorophyti]|uniref:Putative N-acetyltransferase p20-like protein 2 n=1 Tax=Colletotrichum chlorophyti TaxID=708187 RepID=A0A1Q8RL44_9PEZI|nr:putative N-acetyltransferase p20-like protein 2 [Colletotrichum chlorophyti]
MLAPFPQDAYKIVTPRLVIRSATPDDAEGLHSILTTPDNQPFETVKTDVTPDDIRARIGRWQPMTASGKNAFMVVALRETGEIIGNGGFNCFELSGGETCDVAIKQARESGDERRITPYLTDTGVVLDHRQWGKGYGREVLCAKIEYAMEELGCSVVRVETDEANKPWRALMASLGLGHLEVIGPVSYDENLIAVGYSIDAATWKVARESLRQKGKWPL